MSTYSLTHGKSVGDPVPLGPFNPSKRKNKFPRWNNRRNTVNFVAKPAGVKVKAFCETEQNFHNSRRKKRLDDRPQPLRASTAPYPIPIDDTEGIYLPPVQRKHGKVMTPEDHLHKRREKTHFKEFGSSAVPMGGPLISARPMSPRALDAAIARYNLFNHHRGRSKSPKQRSKNQVVGKDGRANLLGGSSKSGSGSGSGLRSASRGASPRSASPSFRDFGIQCSPSSPGIGADVYAPRQPSSPSHPTSSGSLTERALSRHNRIVARHSSGSYTDRAHPNRKDSSNAASAGQVLKGIRESREWKRRRRSPHARSTSSRGSSRSGRSYASSSSGLSDDNLIWARTPDPNPFRAHHKRMGSHQEVTRSGRRKDRIVMNQMARHYVSVQGRRPNRPNALNVHNTTNTEASPARRMSDAKVSTPPTNSKYWEKRWPRAVGGPGYLPKKITQPSSGGHALTTRLQSPS